MTERDKLIAHVQDVMEATMDLYADLAEQPVSQADIHALGDLSKVLAYNVSLFVTRRIPNVSGPFTKVLLMAYNLGHNRGSQTQDLVMFEDVLASCNTDTHGHERQP